MSEVDGLAALPHLTWKELAILLVAVDSRRLQAKGEERRVLWSLSTSISDAMFAAELDGKRRREEAGG